MNLKVSEITTILHYRNIAMIKLLSKKARVFNKSGQSLSEFALILAVAVGVISTMQIYVQRGLQARYKQGANYAFSQIEAEAALKGVDNLTDIAVEQYEPYYRQAFTSVETNSDNTMGFPTATINETAARSGWESVASGYDAD